MHDFKIIRQLAEMNPVPVVTNADPDWFDDAEGLRTGGSATLNWKTRASRVVA